MTPSWPESYLSPTQYGKIMAFVNSLSESEKAYWVNYLKSHPSVGFNELVLMKNLADQANMAYTNPTPSTAQSLSLGGGFKIANEAPKRRLVIAVDGLDKEGKSNFLLTAPGPIAYQNFDTGTEGVIEKFQTSKIIHRADYKVKILKGMSPEQAIGAAAPAWEQFVEDYKIALDQGIKGKIKTIGWDTASENWEILRLARLGKLTQVMPHHYTALNTEYRNLVREVFDTPLNMVLLHKLKPEWKDSTGSGKGNKTGNYERAGFGDMAFLVQINVICWRDKDGHFHVTVKNCRQNPAVAGLDLVDEMASFKWLAVNVYPDTMLEDWE